MPSAVSQAQGATGNAQGIATDLLNQGGDIYNLGTSNLKSFSNYLSQLASGNPAEVSQAAGPQIANISEQSKNAADQISTLPRGGEKDYLLAENDISKSSDISKLLDSIIQQAQQERGTLGEWGTTTGLSTEGQSANIQLEAANNLLSQAYINQMGSSGTADTIGQILQFAAAAAGG